MRNRGNWLEGVRHLCVLCRHEKGPPLRALAEMGWHCITIWEGELKLKVREQTLKSLAFTLNKIWLDDHRAAAIPYPQLEEENGILKAAEEKI